MADQYDFVTADEINQLRKIVDEVRHRIGTFGRPGTVAMTAKIRRHNMEVTRKCPRSPVPAARVIERSVHQDHGRG